jgi:hypothetical protein
MTERPPFRLLLAFAVGLLGAGCAAAPRHDPATIAPQHATASAARLALEDLRVLTEGGDWTAVPLRLQQRVVPLPDAEQIQVYAQLLGPLGAAHERLRGDLRPPHPYRSLAALDAAFQERAATIAKTRGYWWNASAYPDALPQLRDDVTRGWADPAQYRSTVRQYQAQAETAALLVQQARVLLARGPTSAVARAAQQLDRDADTLQHAIEHSSRAYVSRNVVEGSVAHGQVHLLIWQYLANDTDSKEAAIAVVVARLGEIRHLVSCADIEARDLAANLLRDLRNQLNDSASHTAITERIQRVPNRYHFRAPDPAPEQP